MSLCISVRQVLQMSVTTLTGSDLVGGGDTAGNLQQARARPRWSRKVAMDLIAVGDVIAVVIGCMLPAGVYMALGHPVTSWPSTLQLGIVAALIVSLCLRNWGLYATGRMDDIPYDPLKLYGALFIACFAILGLGLPFPASQIFLWVWYAAWISLSLTLMLGLRLVLRPLYARWAREGRFDVRVAVFGAGLVARRVYDHIRDPRLGVQFIGVFDDRAGEERLNPEGLDVTGRLADLVELGRRDGVDQIIIALPQSADRRIMDVARKLEQLPASLHVVTHIASDLVDEGPAYKVSGIGSVGLLDVKDRPLSDWAPLLKTAEDYVLGAIFTLVSLPLMALIAIAIKLDSSGPVFFVQRRRGLNQRIIEVLKFRTMHVMEDGTDVRQATTADPRITRVGHWLRRTSLDELPQLFNVLKGDMALVGPRPHALVHDELFTEVLDRYAARSQVKPGITGLAQVRGFRGDTSTAEKLKRRVENDLEYINSWSLWLDLKIIGRTTWAMISGRNAH